MSDEAAAADDVREMPWDEAPCPKCQTLNQVEICGHGLDDFTCAKCSYAWSLRCFL